MLPPDVSCKKCGFQVAVTWRDGHLSSFSPDQQTMKKRCKRAQEQNFAFDCSFLGSALLAAIEHEAHSPLAGLRVPSPRASEQAR